MPEDLPRPERFLLQTTVCRGICDLMDFGAPATESSPLWSIGGAETRRGDGQSHWRTN